MAEFLFKDRVTSTPNRIKLTKVAEDTYDVEKIPGEIVEEGTPLNSTTMNKLAQKSGLIRPNMLINSNFAINTLGKSVYNINGEPACDGWEVIKGGGAYYDATTKTLHCVAGGEYAWLRQRMPWIDLTKLIGKTITMSVRCKASRNKYFDIGYYRGTSYISLIQYSSTTVDSDFVTVTVKKTIPDTVLATDIFCPRIYCNVPSSDPSGTASLQLEWAKLEIGEYATEYQPPIEGEEFARVKRYLDKADISTVMPISSASASNSKVFSEKLAYDQLALKAPLANPTFTGTVTVPAPTDPTHAARLADVTGLSAVYDIVIKTQTEFEELIGSSDWLGAESVALVGQFTLSTPNNRGIKIPPTVKQIHGFNSAKITVTNFKFDISTGKGGLWYDTAPTTNDYSIRDLEVSCTGTDGYGFTNCNNLTNCTGTGTGTSFGRGFIECNNLLNCTGTGTGTTNGYGFVDCINLLNCTGTGTGTGGNSYGFRDINYAVNCKDGGSSTAMWGGTNKNIDLDTCRKTPVEADKTELNT